MGIAERKVRERAERENRIVAVAREIAESEGWNAVTIRRLAEAIEYSQPVVYSHFENRDAIVAAVALDGFRALTTALRQAAEGAADRETVLGKAATAYLDFAREKPALYEAMFTLPTPLLFAAADTRAELKDGFIALAAVVAPANADTETATETFWAALHGLAELERSSRIRIGARDDRVALIVRGFVAL